MKLIYLTNDISRQNKSLRKLPEYPIQLSPDPPSASFFIS